MNRNRARPFYTGFRTPPGGQTILEYWIPAGDLGALNASIVGKIELIAEFH